MKDGPLAPREAQKCGLQKPGVRGYVHTAGSTQLDPSSSTLESIGAAELGLPAENQVS